MLAVAKVDCLEFTVYVGMQETYPEWFTDKVLSFAEECEEGFATLTPSFALPKIRGDMWFIGGQIALFEDDVFLINNRGDIWQLEMEKFTDMFYFTDVWDEHALYAGAKSDAMEFTVYEGWHDNYDPWFHEAILDHVIWNGDHECLILPTSNEEVEIGGHKHELEGEMLLEEGDVFLVNKYKQVWRMSQEEFNDKYWVIE